MRRIIVLALGAILLTGGTAFAQDKGDFSAGWNLIRDEGETFAKGWYVDVAGHMNEMLSIVGQVTGNYKDFGGDSFNIHSFQGGVRLRASMVHPTIVPFAQILGGAGRGSFAGFSETDGTLELGGGVNVGTGGPVGGRIQAGYVRVFSEGEGTNIFRFNVGINVGF